MKTNTNAAVRLGFCLSLAAGSAQAGTMLDKAWVARYDGAKGGTDNPRALVVDTAGNAYVTGASDSGSGNYDFATLKYDPAGKQLWAVRYGGESQGADWPNALVVDAAGGVYVSGVGAGKDSGADFVTIKYDANGKQLWVSRYDGPAHGDDRVKAMAVDKAGRVYVTGESAGEGGRTESVTLKYGPGGDLLWAARCSGSASLAAIAVDAGGRVYVTGGAAREGGKTDFVTLKYDAKGKPLWTSYSEWPENDDARFLALDSAGNVYVAGASLRYTEGPEKIGHEAIATVKYDPDGKALWSNSFNGSETSDDVASALCVDKAGAVHLAGTSYGPTGGAHVVFGYDANGKASGPARHGSTDDALTLGRAGGKTEGEARIGLVKFAADCSAHWVAAYPGTPIPSDRGLALDSAGNLWTTGNDTHGRDYVTVKYSRTPTPKAAAKDEPASKESKP